MAAKWFSAPAPVGRRMRAYFAPVERGAQSPVLFDAAAQGTFDLDSPPSPWIGLGWIAGFSRTPKSQSVAVRSGIPAAALAQVREGLDARVTFEFLSWTKLTMALATGAQHMNLLKSASSAVQAACGGTAVTAAAVGSGSTAGFLTMSEAEAGQFPAGTILAVDSDYSGETGYVGSPISGAYLRQALSDVDYIRRVTFNVALVAESTSAGLLLAQDLPGGAPAAGAKLQAVAGFVDREGGCFSQEWSGLFVFDGALGERVFFHYPRLQADSGAEESMLAINESKSGSLKRMALKARFLALPVTDSLDGERVLCYRSFLPAARALV